jgi:hypothetical protein
MKIIVGMPNHSIEDPFVIDKILSHLEGRGSLRVSDSSPWSTRAATSGLLATSRATGARLGMVDRYCIRKRRVGQCLRGGD